MSMGDALTGAMSAHGFNRNQARMAYSNAKFALRNQGLRGRDLRQKAREMITNNPVEEIAEQRVPLIAIDSKTENTPMLANNLDQLAKQQVDNYRQLQDYSSIDFDTAFKNARNAYLSNKGPAYFMWKGQLYNTNLGNSLPSVSSGINQTLDAALTNAQNYFSTNAPATTGAVSYDGYRYLTNLILGKKENGGKIAKAQEGLKVIKPGFSYLGEYYMSDRNNPRQYNIIGHSYRINGEDYLAPTRQGAFLGGVDYEHLYNNEEPVMSRNHFENLRDFYENRLPKANLVQGPKEELMENGGEIDKARKGYKVQNGTFSAQVNSPGDTTRRKVYPSVTQIMQTYPNGAVRYSTTDNRSDFTTNRWDIRNGQPNLWQRLLYGNKRAKPFDRSNWSEIIANHPEDPRNALKQKNGGKVAKKQDKMGVSSGSVGAEGR